MVAPRDGRLLQHFFTLTQSDLVAQRSLALWTYFATGSDHDRSEPSHVTSVNVVGLWGRAVGCLHVFVCMFQAYLVRRNFQGDEFFGGPLRAGRVERPLADLPA